jgi:hypothetical protein
MLGVDTTAQTIGLVAIGGVAVATGIHAVGAVARNVQKNRAEQAAEGEGAATSAAAPPPAEAPPPAADEPPATTGDQG